MTEEIIATVPWHCGNTDGCEQGWHLSNYWTCDDGYTVDRFSDGDHEHIEDVPTADEIVEAERAYAAHVLSTGADPLGNYMVDRASKVERRWQAWFRSSIAGVVCTGVRRRGRGEWTSPNDAPDTVVDFLTIEERRPRLWYFPADEGETPTETLAQLRALAEDDDNVSIQRTRTGLRFTFKVAETKPRPATAVAHELRAQARRDLARRDP